MRRLSLFFFVALWALILQANPDQAGTNSEHADPAPLATPEDSASLQGLSSSADSSQPVMRPPGRLVVSILWFENRAGAEAEHWRFGLENSLGKALGQVKALRFRGGIGYARRRLGIGEGAALNADQALQMGEIVEAQRVIWGHYQRVDKAWQVSTLLLNVASGMVSGPFVATATNWFDVRDRLTEQILTQLETRPSIQENLEMMRRGTSSAQAYECYVKAYAFQNEGRPLAEQEACLRQAIAADAAYADAHAALGAVIGSQGKLDHAVACVRRALEIKQDHAQAHGLLGFCLVMQKKHQQALEELQEALRLEPDDALTLSRLAQLYSVQGKWNQAIVYDEKALSIEPMAADVHAHLGLAYVHRRNRDRAIQELKEAQRLVDPHGPDYSNAEQMISQAYHRLGEIPLAVEHYEAFVTHAQRKGIAPEMIGAFEELTQRLKATLTPTFIEASMPREYSVQALQGALQERLTPVEMKMVVNPVASSPEIRHWAQQLTEGVVGELDRARAIFQALIRRIQMRGGFGKRTAQEVFVAWKDPNEVFSCQEFAKLYLALAREVDLKVFYVHLGRDYRGKLVFHDCAIVFVGEKALLVDPAYQWFGVPHRTFTVLDDMQTVAHHLFQHVPGERTVPRCRVAVKLHPDFAWGQMSLAGALWGADRPKEAQQALEVVEQLEPGRWDAHRLRGRMAAESEDWDTATTHLNKALELNPEDAESHFLLGATLVEQGKRQEAREAFRTCLRSQPRDSVADRARRAIVQINEEIGAESGPAYATAALMLAIEQGKTETVGRMLAEGMDANTQESSGLTALMAAALHGHLDIVRLLLEHGANVNMRDKTSGGTALMAATHEGNADMITLLLGHQADVDVQSKAEGLTALMIASDQGRVEAVSLLLEAGAGVNIKDKVHGVSALFMAAQNGHTEIVRRLLENGAVANIKAQSNQATPLLVASAKGHIEIVRLLIQAGADVTAEAMGRTALSAARAKGHSEIADLLVKALQAQLDSWVSQGMLIPQDELLAYYEEVKTRRSAENAKLQFRLIDIRPLELDPAQINSSEGQTPEKVAFRLATELCAQARKGEDFGQLARTYSHGHRGPLGGLWNPVTPSSLAAPYDALTETLRSLQAGQVSSPVQTEGHVFVVKLERAAREEVPSFDALKDDLIKELQLRKREKLEREIGR